MYTEHSCWANKEGRAARRRGDGPGHVPYTTSVLGIQSNAGNHNGSWEYTGYRFVHLIWNESRREKTCIEFKGKVGRTHLSQVSIVSHEHYLYKDKENGAFFAATTFS